jgi:hypothetical protein
MKVNQGFEGPLPDAPLQQVRTLALRRQEMKPANCFDEPWSPFIVA